MSYETITLATVAYNRVVLKDDAAVLNASSSTFANPDQLILKRSFPKPSSNGSGVLRGSIKTTRAVTLASGKVVTGIIETTSSLPADYPAADAAILLARAQSATANEALATDVLTKGIVY